ncbi:hypothetical protein B0T16DRAFT_429655 [Cercophora newfieldiana]|uniref:Cupin type-2 domain-containing protein n=1 Tax=Cercophora newfieldiana TaxID=92897 RepID=A0AA39Y7Y9_9PEZI|nr:hypothetical protein B0T16DRAFT_429655 [Cercophora newfieldiana]
MGDRPSSPARADNGKLSTLPQLHRFITGHNEAGKAIVHSHNDFLWKPYDENQLAFSDIKAHHETLATGNLGLVNPRGTVLRCVDFAPGYACGMHRTQSLDYGIVLEGEVDMVLDSGEVHRMRRGDVAVQWATQHQWVNRSQTEWARMMFVLHDCKPLVVGGESGLPASGN